MKPGRRNGSPKGVHIDFYNLGSAASAGGPAGDGRAPKSAVTQTEPLPRPTTTRPLNAGAIGPILAGKLGMERADRLRRPPRDGFPSPPTRANDQPAWPSRHSIT